jgi:hypothetical protein
VAVAEATLFDAPQAKAPKVAVRAGDVVAALRERFCPPEWAFMEQVANGTGARNYRWADAVAMNLYPSRGLEMHGFEVKVSRSDWVGEMRNPAKAEAVARYCDRWWIAAGSESIVGAGELPPTWGLLVLEKGKIRTHTAAPKLTPEPVSRAFLAAVLRRAQEQVTDEARVRKLVDAARRSASKSWEDEVERMRERHTADMQAQRETMLAFNMASGHVLSKYNAERLGGLVRAAERLGADRLATVRENLASALAAVDAVLAPEVPRG